MSDFDITPQQLDEAAKALLAQNVQQAAIGQRTAQLREGFQELHRGIAAQDLALDDLLAQAEALCQAQGLRSDMVTEDDFIAGQRLMELTEEEQKACAHEGWQPLEQILIQDCSWKQYLQNMTSYASTHGLSLEGDVLTRLMTPDVQERVAHSLQEQYTLQKAHCDSLEWGIAAFSGVVSGLVDSFFVGCPGSSKLGDWSDKQCDDFVKSFARNRGWKPQEKNQESVASAIGWLERHFKVNYDARFAKDLCDAEKYIPGMTPANHHLYSLGHAPDLIGLLFSVLDQFTNKTSLISDTGKIVRLRSANGSNFELQGETFLAKLACGIVNWIGHLVSDMAGSSGTRGHTDHSGAGIPPPLFELFQFARFSPKQGQPGPQEVIAKLTMQMYEKEYDLRFAGAMAVPVVLNEFLIRLLFALKRYFYNGLALGECIPLDVDAIRRQPELRVMLLAGHGVLVTVDTIDAGCRSGGNLLNFAMHMNFIAWQRLAFGGIVALRSMYASSALDLQYLDQNLEYGWAELNASC